jgi:hypothetical protein
MFRGDHPDLRRVLHSANVIARELGHPRTGSEHVVLALSTAGGAVTATLDRHGATEAVLQQAVRHAAPLGAGAAADRESLAPLGINVDQLFSRLAPTTPTATRHPRRSRGSRPPASGCSGPTRTAASR